MCRNIVEPPYGHYEDINLNNPLYEKVAPKYLIDLATATKIENLSNKIALLWMLA